MGFNCNFILPPSSFPLFSWFRNLRRRELLAKPFPKRWAKHLQTNVPYFVWLTAEQQAQLQDDLRIFIAEKQWVGCGGLKVTDEMRVTIAAQACLIVLGIKPTYHYERVKSVLIYPGPYQHPRLRWNSSEVFSAAILAGEAWPRSPIVLSWRDVLAGGANPHDGRNVVFHEFAHHLDGIDGDTDGTPPLESREQYRRWDDVFFREFRQLVQAAKEGGPTLLDYYGATNEAEFFAVASECFFECGGELRARHPELYEILHGFYRLDTASWPQGPSRLDRRPRDRPYPGRQVHVVADHGDDNQAGDTMIAVDEGSLDRLLKQARIEPGTADAHFTLGHAYLNAEQFARAADEFARALELNPADAETMRYLGVAKLRQGDASAAVEQLTKSIERDPSDDDAFRDRAEAEIRLSRFEDALADLDRADSGTNRPVAPALIRFFSRIGLATIPAANFYLRGLALSGLHRYSDAVASLSRAIQHDPKQAEYFAARSRVHELLGEREQAESDRVDAIRRDPRLAKSLVR